MDAFRAAASREALACGTTTAKSGLSPLGAGRGARRAAGRPADRRVARGACVRRRRASRCGFCLERHDVGVARRASLSGSGGLRGKRGVGVGLGDFGMVENWRGAGLVAARRRRRPLDGVDAFGERRAAIVAFADAGDPRASDAGGVALLGGAQGAMGLGWLGAAVARRRRKRRRPRPLRNGVRLGAIFRMVRGAQAAVSFRFARARDRDGRHEGEEPGDLARRASSRDRPPPGDSAPRRPIRVFDVRTLLAGVEF